MIIRYKVVNPDRTSYIVHKDSKFSLKYPKNGIVHAILGSIGIAIFNTFRNAEYFTHFAPNKKAIILTVEPIGEEKTMLKVANVIKNDTGINCDKIITHFLSKKAGCEFTIGRTPPEGTLFYSAVKVIDCGGYI